MSAEAIWILSAMFEKIVQFLATLVTNRLLRWVRRIHINQKGNRARSPFRSNSTTSITAGSAPSLNSEARVF